MLQLNLWLLPPHSRGCWKLMSGLSDGDNISTLHVIPTYFGIHIVGNIVSDYIIIVFGYIISLEIRLFVAWICLSFISDRFQMLSQFWDILIWNCLISVRKLLAQAKLLAFGAMAWCYLELALSHRSGEVATASYTTQLGFWNICDIPKAKLCREQKAVDVFVFHSVLIQHVVWCRLFFCPPWRQPIIWRLLGSQEVQGPSSGCWSSGDQRRLRTRQFQSSVRSPYFATVCLSQSKSRKGGHWLQFAWSDAVMRGRLLRVASGESLFQGLNRAMLVPSRSIRTFGTFRKWGSPKWFQNHHDPPFWSILLFHSWSILNTWNH